MGPLMIVLLTALTSAVEVFASPYTYTSVDYSNQYSNEPVTTTDVCMPRNIKCYASPYREIDGTCNNYIFPFWGAVPYPFNYNYVLRLISPAGNYDKFYERSPGVNKTSARIISTTVFNNYEKPSSTLTHMAMSWGQMMAHDSVNSTEKTNVDSCCVDDDKKAIQDDNCAAVDIPEDDFHFAAFNKTCQDIMRIQTNRDKKCPYIYKYHQINSVTPPLDLSLVYGNTLEQMSKLRSYENGCLKYEEINGQNYSTTGNEGCDSDTKYCFNWGDSRGNQNLGVVCMQTLMLRAHNGICEELKIVNPHWYDEQLFQTARKILIAIYQHITYYYYLRLVLGPEIGNKFTSRDPATAAKWSTYNPFTHPGTIAEWNLCWRQMHTLVREKFEVCDEDGYLQEGQGYVVSDYYNRPDPIVDNYDGLMCGLAVQPAKKADMNVVDSIWKYLFKRMEPPGEDLMCYDFQRGREWDVPNYTKQYENIWGIRLGSWQDLRRVMGLEKIEQLKKIYPTVEDVEFYPATLMENKAEGSEFGKTCAIILGEQFRRWETGDRFYYFFNWFTKAQLDQIQSMTLSKLICKFSTITAVSHNAFRPPGKDNSRVKCSEIGFMSFDPWKEDEYY